MFEPISTIMYKELKILPVDLLESYCFQVNSSLQTSFDNLKDVDDSNERFSFYSALSAIASSRIEGEPMGIEYYIQYKMANVHDRPEPVKKTDDLYLAYLFAQQNKLNRDNFFEAYTLLARHLLIKSDKGICRAGNRGVTAHQSHRMHYDESDVGAGIEFFELLWKDISHLNNRQLTYEEVFYFAALIHLAFVNIQPFGAGNGRAGRLLEKWFIAEKSGVKAWFIQSELNYYKNVNEYYNNLNRLDLFSGQSAYAQAIPFLLMLPDSLLMQPIRVPK